MRTDSDEFGEVGLNEVIYGSDIPTYVYTAAIGIGTVQFMIMECGVERIHHEQAQLLVQCRLHPR